MMRALLVWLGLVILLIISLVVFGALTASHRPTRPLEDGRMNHH